MPPNNDSLPGFDGSVSGALLESVDGIFIRQKPDLAEALLGVECKNVYHVSPIGIKDGPNLFTCKEESGYCARQCCSASMTPLTMNVKNDYSKTVELVFEKEYRISCCCLNRP